MIESSVEKTLRDRDFFRNSQADINYDLMELLQDDVFGFTPGPVGIHNSKPFQCMSQNFNSEDEIVDFVKQNSIIVYYITTSNRLRYALAGEQ